MEIFIPTGTKEFTSTHYGRAREKDNTYGFRRDLLAEVIGDQSISNDYVDGERDIGERDGEALEDSSPGRCGGRTWIAQQNRQSRRESFRLIYFAV